MEKIKRLIHPEEAEILHNRDTLDNFRVDSHILTDCDGEVEFRFPDSWTDRQIMYALDIANEFYNAGVRHGKIEKVAEIRKALAE